MAKVNARTAPPDVDLADARHLAAQDGDDETDAEARDRESRGAAEEREQGRLGEELAHDAAAARAEGRADRELLAAAERPGQHEVGHVRARDQEDEAHRAEQHEQRRPHIADEVLVQRDDRRPPALVVRGVLGRKPRGDGVHLRPCAGDARAGLQAREHQEVVDPADGPFFGREGEGNPEPAVLGETAPGREHADHGVLLAVGDEVAPDRSGVRAETRLPEFFREDRHAMAGLVVAGCEEPSGERAYAEDGEEVGRDVRRRDRFRLSRTGQRHAVGGQDRHLLEDVVLRLPVEVVRRRDAEGLHAGEDVLRRNVRHDDEAVRVGIREGLQEDGVDDAEDRRVRADAEREDADRHGRKARVLPQHAERVSDVLRERSHRCLRFVSGAILVPPI